LSLFLRSKPARVAVVAEATGEAAATAAGATPGALAVMVAMVGVSRPAEAVPAHSMSRVAAGPILVRHMWVRRTSALRMSAAGASLGGRQVGASRAVH
jgi:hypothetical protein